LSAALDSGVAVSAVLIFFILQYPKNGDIGINNIQVWWGNSVPYENAEYLGAPMIKLAKNATFGPDKW
jgi:hypothetical protein